MSKYVIGLDFGTLSCRAILVDINTGYVIAESENNYKHGVMDEFLNGTKLPENYALQNPYDYLESMESTIKNIIESSKISVKDIIGIGSDFTSSTILPLDNTGELFIDQEKYVNNPHAYVKLWKHHAAEKQAEEITKHALDDNEVFINQYGGTISSEWMLPKVFQILEEEPELYRSASTFIEAGDWINFKLTGKDNRSVCQAGFKGLYYDSKFPSDNFLQNVNIGLKDYTTSKMGKLYSAPGTVAGTLNEYWGKRLGLPAGIPVAVSIIDAHAGMIGAGVVKDKTMFIAIGTSSCHLLLDKKKYDVIGTSGYVKDGVIPGYYAYEAGQASVGDAFEWLVNILKKDSESASDAHERLTNDAKNVQPGSNGTLAIDWLNGCRTPYVNYNLSGAFLGINLRTKPEEMYRSLIEATAFGTKQILNLYENEGIAIEKIIVSGGISYKNELLLQIYSDVTNRIIEVSESRQSGALGSAISAAVAAGIENGGYENFQAAVNNMVKKPIKRFVPNDKYVPIYEKVYQLYEKVGKIFAKEHQNIMEELLEMKN